MLSGEKIKIADDLRNLPEFDWDDPKNQKWAQEEEQRFKDVYGRISHEEIFQLADLRKKIHTNNPSLSSKEAAKLALKQFKNNKAKTS